MSTDQSFDLSKTNPTIGEITLTHLGHNIGFNTGEISVDLWAEDGTIIYLELPALLENIDRLHGRHHRLFGIKERLLAALFLAYESNFLTMADRQTFESYVRNHIASLSSIEAARRLVLG